MNFILYLSLLLGNGDFVVNQKFVVPKCAQCGTDCKCTECKCNQKSVLVPKTDDQCFYDGNQWVCPNSGQKSCASCSYGVSHQKAPQRKFKFRFWK